MRVNQRVVLISRPDGIPQAHNFALDQESVGEPGPGQVLIRNRYLSVDLAQRGWTSLVPNYLPPVQLGEVMRAFAVGTVTAVGHGSAHSVGDQVVGLFGWQEWAIVDDSVVDRVLPNNDTSASLALSVLGLTGVTAWFGITDLAQPKPGDTVVVSTAAGSVGSIAGQLARLAGARTVGITGGAAKVALCRDEFGYDVALDYRSESFIDDLAAALPSGANAYFDNTGGSISDAVMTHLSVGARVVVCGTASVASWDPWPTGPRIERLVLTRRLRIIGLLAFDYQHRTSEALDRLSSLVARGDIRVREEFLDGLHAAPDSIAGLYRGENLGKRIIRLENLDT